MQRLTIELSEETAEFVRDSVARGDYPDADTLVEGALVDRMDEGMFDWTYTPEGVAHIRKLLAEADESGPSVPWDSQAIMAELEERSRNRRRAAEG